MYMRSIFPFKRRVFTNERFKTCFYDTKKKVTEVICCDRNRYIFDKEFICFITFLSIILTFD
jgi:hypothetical protein